MPTGRRKPDPDRILCAHLSGTAIRLARAGGPINEAVAELRGLAGGRADLLASHGKSRYVTVCPECGTGAAGSVWGDTRVTRPGGSAGLKGV